MAARAVYVAKGHGYSFRRPQNLKIVVTHLLLCGSIFETVHFEDHTYQNSTLWKFFGRLITIIITNIISFLCAQF